MERSKQLLKSPTRFNLQDRFKEVEDLRKERKDSWLKIPDYFLHPKDFKEDIVSLLGKWINAPTYF